MKKYDLYYIHVKDCDNKTIMEKECLTKKERNHFIKDLKNSYNLETR